MDLRNAGLDDGPTQFVFKDRLLETLKANRTTHVEEYEEAVVGYKEAAKTRLSEELENAEAKIAKAHRLSLLALDEYDPSKAEDVIVFCEAIRFKLPAPRCYASAYDQAIEQVEWSSREEFELTTQQFRCFVMNKWDWVESFKTVSEFYKSR